MTPARLARWASRFRRGELRGPPGLLRWDGVSPAEDALAPWSSPRGRCEAELVAGSELVVKLIPGVALVLPGSAVLRLEVPLSDVGRLADPASAVVAGGAWSLRLGGAAVEAFDTVVLTRDGRVVLRSQRGGVRGVALRAGSRGLTAALRRSPRWRAVAPWLAEPSAVQLRSPPEVP